MLGKSLQRSIFERRLTCHFFNTEPFSGLSVHAVFFKCCNYLSHTFKKHNTRLSSPLGSSSVFKVLHWIVFSLSKKSWSNASDKLQYLTGLRTVSWTRLWGLKGWDDKCLETTVWFIDSQTILNLANIKQANIRMIIYNHELNHAFMSRDFAGSWSS